MAGIYRRDGSKFWMARFRLADGTWSARSTKTTNPTDARRLAFLWEGASASLNFDNPTAAQVDRVVRDVWERYSGKRLEPNPAGEFLRTWRDRMLAQRAAKTGERYRKVIDDFLKHLGTRESFDLRATTLADVQSFIDSEAKSGKSGTTVTLNAKILRAAFNAAIRAGAIEKNPAAAVELPEAAHEEREPFTAGDVEAILTETKGTEWETAVLLGAYAGLRLGDAARMRWGAVDLAGGLLTFLPEKVRRKKRELRVPIHSRLAKHLEAIAGDVGAAEFLCPTLAPEPVSGRAGLSSAFMKIMREAGVDAQQGAEREGVGHRFSKKSFHSLRHFFLTGLANKGVAADVRRKLAGHADEKQTQRYSHLEIETLRRAVAKLR